MDNEKLDPKNSKCFSCKHGLCTLQENSAFIETNFTSSDGPDGGLFKDNDLDWDQEEGDGEHQEPQRITEHRVCSMCYWAPPGITIDSPIVYGAAVSVCSRYESES